MCVPASPPSWPSGWLNAVIEPLLLNWIDGVMTCNAAAACIVGRRTIPAGFDHTVLASSATAAPPA